ncbi:polysaccharide biosynthesis/export family protein, partial [Proteus mirabilis]
AGRALLVALFCLGGALLSGSAGAEPFRLGQDDKVDVRVFGRPDLSMSLKIDADGNLRLPLVGSVP